MSEKTRADLDAELAAHYEESRDVRGFDEDASVPVEVRRNVTISVRFSDEEISNLRQYADRLGIKVTTLIRTAALDEMHRETRPMDREALARVVGALEEQTHRLADLVSPRF